jgi:prephenate dehydrogenase
MSDTNRQLPVIQPGTGDGSSPIFDKVAIVGLGLIGGSIALAVRETWPTSLVIGVDDKDVLERAMVRHAIDVAADDPVVMAEAELVILAAPVKQNIDLLDDLDQYIPGTAIVTDVSSTKLEIVDRARRLPSRFTFVGGHPLGGAPQGGIDYARADLFRGRPWIFTPTIDGTGHAFEQLQAFVTALGSQPHVMTAAEHDRLLAYLSHLPQLTASTLMHVVGEAAGQAGLVLTGRGLSDTTRLASSPPTIWRDICSTNTDEIRLALDALVIELTRLRDGLKSEGVVDRVFESAAEWRGHLPKKPLGRDRQG